MACPLFPDINQLMMLVCLIFLFAIISNQWKSLLRPYQHGLMVR